MSTGEGLLAAICAEPDDDNLRLIYADWLEERGDTDSLARAEFIRVQVALAAMAGDDPGRGELEARERDLLTEHEQDWVAPFRRFHLEAWSFERGLIEYMILPADSFLQGAEELFSETPLQEVRFIPGTGSIEELVDHPPLACLRGLDLAGWHLGNEGFLTLVRSPYLPRLQSLLLEENSLVVRGAAAIAEALPPQAADLTELDLSINDVGDDGAEVLARLVALRNLTVLSLRQHYHTPYHDRIHAVGVTALADSPHLTELVALDLAHNAIGDAGLRALAGWPKLRQFRRLNLRDNGIGDIGDAGIQRLVTSPYLEQLTVLDLSSNPLGVAGASALAEWPWMERLAVLDLSSCGLRNLGLMRLLASPHGRNLRVLNLAANDIGDRGGFALAEAPYLPSNVRLDLRTNRIGSDCRAALRARFVHAVLLDELP